MAYTKEGVPGFAAGLDGAITDSVSDGAWTEPPVQGAYTSIGYDKEFKPFLRFTHVNEAVPSSVVVGAGVGALASPGSFGMLVTPGEVGVVDVTYSRTLEPKPTA